MTETLQGKAADGEILPVTSGSTNFNMRFAAVPEPSSVILLLLGTALFLKNSRFLKPRQPALIKIEKHSPPPR